MRGSKHNMDRREYCATGARLYANRGSDAPHAITDEATVAKIRRLHARKKALIERINRQYGIAALAQRYGLSHRAVERILARETWSHVR